MFVGECGCACARVSGLYGCVSVNMCMCARVGVNAYLCASVWVHNRDRRDMLFCDESSGSVGGPPGRAGPG